jgi:hypothetical protein
MAMRLVLIEGGLGLSDGDQDQPKARICTPGPLDVGKEARRRLREAGWEQWQVKSVATGCAIPQDLRYIAMQINYVAEALARLATIPDDFRSDAYWPQFTS